MTPNIDLQRILAEIAEIALRLYKSIPWYLRWIAKPMFTDLTKLIDKLEEYITKVNRP